jgi:hypothetical protein
MLTKADMLVLPQCNPHMTPTLEIVRVSKKSIQAIQHEKDTMNAPQLARYVICARPSPDGQQLISMLSLENGTCKIVGNSKCTLVYNRQP